MGKNRGIEKNISFLNFLKKCLAEITEFTRIFHCLLN